MRRLRRTGRASRAAVWLLSSLRMLATPTDLESELLGCFKYQPNIATLHTDESFMPKSKKCWASWNYRIKPTAGGGSGGGAGGD